MIELILRMIAFCVLTVFVSIFTHPFMSSALMFLWVLVYKECKKND